MRQEGPGALPEVRQTLIARRQPSYSGDEMLAATLQQMAEAPVGRFVAGRCHLHFCATASLWGLVLWGRPAAADAQEVGRSIVLELPRRVAPHCSLVDATRLEGAGSEAFQALDGYMKEFGTVLARQIVRLALVRPAGIEGAIVAGIYDVVPRPFPVEVFATVDDALAWLDQPPVVDASIPAGFSERLAEIVSATRGEPQLVSRLRATLQGQLPRVSLADAAAALGVSERTLQRRLTEAGTTFQDELASARLSAAKRRMIDTEAPLTAVALDVGYSSLQHFSALFRRVVGESPSHWRDKQRR
jgi:AraC-like DNA-binding protein